MQIVNIKIKDLKPAKYNPRKELTPEDEEYKKIKRSIEEFGYIEPIIINKDMTIIGGHQRANVLKDLGYNEVECIIVDLDKTKEKALNIALNKITGEWDYTKLSDLLLDLDTENYDLTLTGFDTFEIENMLAPITDGEIEVIEDNFEVEVPEEPKSKLGDIYQLGNHRLMCGDSTSEEDVAKLMNGEIADLVVTDPPYNVAIGIEDIEEAKIRKRRTDGLLIQNDAMEDEKFYNFLKKAFVNIYNNIKSGGVFYVWYASREVVNFQTALEKAGLTVKQELIWNKNSLVMGRQDYQWKHEPCLYGWKEGEAHYFVDDRTQTTIIEDEKQDFTKMRKEELVKLLEEIYSDKISTTIIKEKRPSVSDLHPTMKPIKLIARQVKNSSKIGEKVLDLFGGSGSTLITCEQLNRNCYMMEYDPHYVDVIINRWEQYTGEKAIKLN
jgi:DNA modification methylase